MDVQATFFATLVDEWVRCGLTDAVVCPGNRSTLLSATLAQHPALRVHVMVDERSASFFALGLGLATGRPALFWCTSGTAAAEAHAAVIEADLSHVPLLVCTADRPPELHHIRDWQSIDQSQLYGSSLRWQFDPGVAHEQMRGSWRSIAARAIGETRSNARGAGPVHLNLPIREPWAFERGALPEGRQDAKPWHSSYAAPGLVTGGVVEELATLAARRGVIVVGRSSVDPDALHRCAARLGWPVIAESRSGCRLPRASTVVRAHHMLQSKEFAESHRPEVVLRFGTPVLSKVVASWLKASNAHEWIIDDNDVWEGPATEINNFLRADPTSLCNALAEAAKTSAPGEWHAGWRHADDVAQSSLCDALKDKRASEPAVIRSVAESVPHGAALFAATSMPVRYLEWYTDASTTPVFANRGASGMDGITSTAAGVALGRNAPVVLVVGDLTALYDLNALWALRGADSSFDLTVVVIDNNGGGIFGAFADLQSIGTELFERIVATPQNVDIVPVAQALGIAAKTVDAADIGSEVQMSVDAGGMRLLRVVTNRHEAQAVAKDLTAAVTTALHRG